jgi:hypothetical protein
VVLFDGSKQGERALGLAKQLASGEGKGVKVLLLGTDKKALRKGVEKVLGKGEDIAHIIGRIKSAEDPRLPTVLAGASPGTVVLPIGGETANEEDLQELLEAVDCPVLLVC